MPGRDHHQGYGQRADHVSQAACLAPGCYLRRHKDDVQRTLCGWWLKRTSSASLRSHQSRGIRIAWELYARVAKAVKHELHTHLEVCVSWWGLCWS